MLGRESVDEGHFRLVAMSASNTGKSFICKHDPSFQHVVLIINLSVRSAE